MHRAACSALALALAAPGAGWAQEGELNLYSSRHYDTDERLYSDFEEQTGVTINRIEGDADELIARMEAEGANSPADVLLTVDTSRLERAKEAGILQPVESEVLEARIPPYIQDEDDEWFGFSQRARIIFYDRERRRGARRRPTWTWPTRATRAWSARAPPPTSTPRRCSRR